MRAAAGLRIHVRVHPALRIGARVVVPHQAVTSTTIPGSNCPFGSYGR